MQSRYHLIWNMIEDTANAEDQSHFKSDPTFHSDRIQTFVFHGCFAQNVTNKAQRINHTEV